MADYLLHRKDRFIITAIEIIDELGIQGLSTREIARRQEVSEATLFRHYKNKNELLLAVLDFLIKFDSDIFLTTQIKKLSPIDAIRFLVKTTAEYNENYPEITALLQLFETLRYEENLAEKIRFILNQRALYIIQLIEEAKEVGTLSHQVDSNNLADIILGFYRELCLRWRINNRNFSLKEKTVETLDQVLIAFGSL